MAALALLFTLLSLLVVTRQRARITRLEDQVRRLRYGNAALLDRLHYQERHTWVTVDRNYHVTFEEE